MRFIATSQKPTSLAVEVLGIFLPFGDDALRDAAALLPKNIKAELLKASGKTHFHGKPKETFFFYTHSKLPCFLLAFYGIGEMEYPKDTVTDRLREAAALLGETSAKHHATSVGAVIADPIHALLTCEIIGEAIAEGMLLGNYKFTKYKKRDEEKKKEKPIETCYIVTENQHELEKGLQSGEIEASGVLLARDLINEPPAHMQPKTLAQEAEKIAKKAGKAMRCKIFYKEGLKAMGCGGILAISQGSNADPFLIHLIYIPENKKSSKKIAIVGKGITFDSGGLSIKPADYMDNMKSDMSGAAAVLGLFSILPRLHPSAEIHGIIPTCENMPSGDAIKPGDIVAIMNGKTVEVLNTDAEGRIILADALSYAVEQKVDAIIDLATLTGACIVALGNDIAGIMGNNEALVEDIIAASKKAGEKIWQLPLEQSYHETIKSDVADLRNTSTMRGGGAITAGLFLEQFVSKIPWAHIDIAGPSWTEKPTVAYIGKGGVGFGVRTLAHYVENLR